MPDNRSAPRPLRVAIIGSGPSGLYAADALTNHDEVAVSVDVAVQQAPGVPTAPT